MNDFQKEISDKMEPYAKIIAGLNAARTMIREMEDEVMKIMTENMGLNGETASLLLKKTRLEMEIKNV
jgi:hypothetical protein